MPVTISPVYATAYDPATFSGRVTDHDGTPLPSGDITIQTVDGSENPISSGSATIGSDGHYSITINNFDDTYSYIDFTVTFNSVPITQRYGNFFHSGGSYTTDLNYADFDVTTPTPARVTFNANVKDYATNNPVGGAIVKVRYGGASDITSVTTDTSGNASLNLPYSGGILEAWVEYSGIAYTSSTWTPSAGQTIDKSWLIDLPASDTYVIRGHLTDNTAGTPVTVSTTYGGGGSTTTDSSGNYQLVLHRGTGPAVINAMQDYEGWTGTRTETIASPNLAGGSDTVDFDFFQTLGFLYDFKGTTYVDGVRTNGVHVASSVMGINTYDSKNYGGNDGYYHIRIGHSGTAPPIIITATYGGITKEYTVSSPIASYTDTNPLDIYLTTLAGSTATPTVAPLNNSTITPTPLAGNGTLVPGPAGNNSTVTGLTGNTTAPSSSNATGEVATPTLKPTPSATPRLAAFPVMIVAVLAGIVLLLLVIGGIALLYRRKK